MFLQSCNIAAVEYDLSGCRARLAADHIKRRGFARAVGTDQASQFALANRKMQAGNGKKAAEVDSNVTQFENSHRLVSSHPARILVRPRFAPGGLLSRAPKDGGGARAAPPRMQQRLAAPSGRPDAALRFVALPVARHRSSPPGSRPRAGPSCLLET